MPDSLGKLQTKDIYVLQTGSIVGLELDLENNGCFYLVDDFQNVYNLFENSEGKTIVKSIVSLEMH